MVKSSYFLLSMLLIPLVVSLDLKIVDEDYLMVGFGGEKKLLKLLIDPVGHFTYLLNKTDSKTIVKQQKTYKFSNSFGTFSGEWETDYVFITDDKNFGFRLNYLAVTEVKDSVLNVDGVIGLGYSDKVPENANLFKVLGSMKDVFNIQNVMTYDKKRSKLIIGRVPEPDSFNPVSFNITQPDENYPINLVQLDKVGFYPKDSKKPEYIDINQPAKLGLIPVIIAPFTSEKLLTGEIVPRLTTKPASIKQIQNNDKFFNDISFTNPNPNIKKQGVLLFDKIGYKFDHTWIDGDLTTSAIRLGDDSDCPSYWYIGIDKLNVNRMDFDFDKNTVILYSTTASEIGKTKYPTIFLALGITILATIVLIIIVRYCCAKKKQKDIKEGEELIYL